MNFFVLQALQLTVDSFGKWIFFWGGVLRKKSFVEIFFKMLLRKK